MKFRQAHKNDANDILSLTHTAFIRYAKEVGKNVKANLETIDDVINDIATKQIFVAINEDDKIIASLRIETINNIGYISRLCSDKSYKHLNPGFELISNVKTMIDLDALCLHTSTKIASLVIFYYKCDFYISSVKNDRGYPRGLFICNLKQNNEIDFEKLVQNR